MRRAQFHINAGLRLGMWVQPEAAVPTCARFGYLRMHLRNRQRYDENWPAVMLKDFATSIIKTLRQHGFQAYLVGGCVRDLLLGREPKDYDVATNATPTQVMSIFPETYAVGSGGGLFQCE